MPAYLVRITDNQDFVGLFCASSVNDLIDHIDESNDPNECEYAVLPSGGVYFPKKVGPLPSLSWNDGNDGVTAFEENIAFWSNLFTPEQEWRFTDYWEEAIMRGSLKWKPFRAAQILEALHP